MHIDKDNHASFLTEFEEKLLQRLGDISHSLSEIEDAMKTVADALEAMSPKTPRWLQVPDD